MISLFILYEMANARLQNILLIRKRCRYSGSSGVHQTFPWFYRRMFPIAMIITAVTAVLPNSALILQKVCLLVQV